MINRYEGNTGRVTRMPEPADFPPPPPPPVKKAPRPASPPTQPSQPPRMPRPGFDLGRLLPGLGEGLDGEDLLLLLILWLLYRESGDQELLIIMGALFLL
jgi:hypothetical protein